MEVAKYSDAVVGQLRGDGQLLHCGSGLKETHIVSRDVESMTTPETSERVGITRTTLNWKHL